MFLNYAVQTRDFSDTIADCCKQMSQRDDQNSTSDMDFHNFQFHVRIISFVYGVFL